MKPFFLVFVFYFLIGLRIPLFSQFAPPVGISGTTALYKDSSVFISWATNCIVSRGLQDISAPSGAYADVGDSLMAVGIAGANGVVSLGDGGNAVVTFNSPIIDLPGPDFAVFENSFDGNFLELAFVEVSSDGVNYFRFPSTSLTDTITQTWSFGLTDATKINNLAGKYKAEYGTPFDLSEIADHILLDKQSITHVKIIDVVGCIQNQYCTRDALGNKINDPWPTAFGSGGFDLDAVGVIHQQNVGVKELELDNIIVYPNPADDLLNIVLPNQEYSVSVVNSIGEEIITSSNHFSTTSLLIKELNSGMYILIITSNGRQKQRLFVKS